MSRLSDSNEFGSAAALVHDTKPFDFDEMLKRKCMYLECLIRFLEIYAQTEIGECDIDIRKCALYVNSPYFENTLCYYANNEKSIYKSLEKDLLHNIPLYRFLKLSDHQIRVFESEHRAQLVQDFMLDCKKHVCLKCIWYESGIYAFGSSSKCVRPYSTGLPFRGGYFHFDKVRRCTYFCEASQDVPLWIESMKIERKRSAAISEFHKRVSLWNQKLNSLDNSLIPIYVDSEDFVDIKCPDDWLDHLAESMSGVLNGKQSKDEIRKNLKIAILIECMIRFVEIYAQTEIGADYRASISKIAKFVYKHPYSELLKFDSYECAYKNIEDAVISGLDIHKFISRS